MNIGVAACGIALLLFVVAGALFAILKGRAAMLVSGFNTLPAKEREQYDAAAMARDMRSSVSCGPPSWRSGAWPHIS